MNTNLISSKIDNFVFDAVGYSKPPVLVLDPRQGQMGLNQIYKQYSPTTVRIRDDAQLEAETQRIDKSVKYIKPAKKVASYAGALLEGISASQDGLSMSLNGILNTQLPSAPTTGLPSIYIVEEDSISPQNMTAFMGRFQQLDDEKKPRVILLANEKLESALRLISSCGENISAHIISTNGLEKVSPVALRCNDFGEYINMFLSEGDGYCCSTDTGSFFPEERLSTEFSKCLALMLKIQSLFRCDRKFEAIESTTKLSAKLEQLRESVRNDEQLNKILCVKAICNLWVSYLTESNIDKIENSLSIAEHLQDDLLTAYALKMSPLISDRSNLTHQMLEKSKKIFEMNGEIEQALFVENNIVDNNLFSDRVDVGRAVRLSDYVLDQTPYIRRSTTFHSNAAIALMVSGNLTKSREYFDRAINAAGPAVNLLTSEVNAQIAAHLDGEKIKKNRMMKLIKKIERSGIDKKFDYQQAVMFGNLWKICESDRDISKYIVKVLKRAKYLNYNEFLDNPDRLVKFAATRSYNFDAKKPEVQPGVVGGFIEKHSLMPASHIFLR